MQESQDFDSYIDQIQLLTPGKSFPETKEETESHEQLWKLDQAKCNQGSNEALFQRTLMMSLIARHHLIYDNGTTKRCSLDFSVEETWTCPPMPTRAFWKNAQFLTMPKPDLAICFRRQAVMPDQLWYEMPKAITALACYENTGTEGERRVFHFLTIEAKKAATSTDDIKAKFQGLNNASQALHNIFEFFREAGQEKTFFSKVRFFSVVASTEGLIIRIHRAIRVASKESGVGFMMKDRPEYPLAFEHQVFSRIQKEYFERETVSETFEKIMIGYGENVLQPLLFGATKAIMAKLNNDLEGMRARENDDFYRHGQTERRRSIDVLRNKNVTPTQR